jgi:hypothetical protein
MNSEIFRQLSDAIAGFCRSAGGRPIYAKLAPGAVADEAAEILEQLTTERAA